MLTRTAHLGLLTVTAAFAALLLVPAADAGTDCECIGNGKRVKQGTVLCLQIGSSSRYLARCERNLNNTSWKKMSDGCPTAGLMSVRPDLAPAPLWTPASG